MPYECKSTIHLDHLKCLNTDQLLDLLEDEETIRETIRFNSKLRGLQRSKAILMSSNCWLAEQNLTLQPFLKKTKLILAEKHEILGQLVSSIQHKQRKLETLQQRISLRVIHRLLKEKINHSISESKNLWQQLTEGKLLLTDFVESIQNSQKFYHKRLIQAEKIQDLIIQTQIYEKEVLPCVQHHPDLLHSPTTIHVFYGLSPVILLPNSQYPHLLQTPCLPPLKHHRCVESHLTLTNNESSCNHCPCKCTEMHRWPQRHVSLQPLNKTQPSLYQTKTSK